MKKYKGIITCATLLLLTSSLTPILSTTTFAEQVNDVATTPKSQEQTQPTISSLPNGETIGNTIANDGLSISTIQAPMLTRSISVHPISIGVEFSYSNKASGKKLKSYFKSAADTTSFVDSATGAFELANSVDSVGVSDVLACLGHLSSTVVEQRAESSEKLISKHQNLGKVSVYLDHVTWKKY